LGKLLISVSFFFVGSFFKKKKALVGWALLGQFLLIVVLVEESRSNLIIGNFVAQTAGGE
jgi:hypothetical protein